MNNNNNNESTKSAEPLRILCIDHAVVVLHMQALIIHDRRIITNLTSVTLPAMQLVTFEESIIISYI